MRLDNDGWMFLVGAAVLIGYLFLSAWTEMGTRWPWQKDKPPKEDPPNPP